MSSVPERADVDDAYKWDLTDLYPDDEAWEAAYDRVEERLEDLRSYEGRVTEDAATLRDVLELREEVMREVSNVVSYARMRRDEDTTDDRYQALLARAQSLASEASSAASFVEPELQSLDRADVEELVAAEPELEQYEHYFDDVLRTKPHTRSTEVETLLAELGEVTGAPGEVYNTLANADMEFPAVETPAARSASERASGEEPRAADGERKRITLNNFTTLQKNPDREFRRSVYEAFYDEWATVRNAVGTAYRNAIKTDEKLAAARNYDTAREAALDGPNIPVDVYDTLVETVRDNLDTLHRHADLKREVIGVEDLRMWDLYVPMVAGESPEVSYEEACEYVTDAVAPLGEDYQSRLAAGLDSRWVDVYETAGKQSGAYSGGTYDSQPYILMNYQDDVSSMYTLAH
ncbi:MAG: M3 family oligoendopeptidase, partial [Halorientalis sp.]